MKEKILNILNTRIKRVTAIAACATLIISLGTISVFAAGIIPSDFVVRNENGNVDYSVDGGETWSKTAPDGYVQTLNPDGSISVRNENANAGDSANGGATWNDDTSDEYGLSVGSDDDATTGASLVKNENGVVSYSTDGGATFSETAPDGFEQTVDADGSVSVKSN